ncbi:hypothetical protein ACP70R_041879 [Stipagrostis hirtigluma subsp. patula]
MAAAGTFQAAVGAIIRFNIAIGLLGAAFLRALPLPPPQSLSSALPSHCVAQQPHYERVALLIFVIFHTVTVSMYLAFGVQLCAGGGLGGMGARTQAWLRRAALLAVALSAVGAGLAVAALTTVLEIKVGVFACLPAGVRAAVYASCGLVGAAGAGFYCGLATAVMRSD